MTRRDFLLSMILAALAAPAMAQTASDNAPTPAQLTLTVDPTRELGRMPADFIGLSYESAQLANPDFFATSNRALISYFRTLGTSGVLRIGGNTSEYSDWSPDLPPGNAPSPSGPSTASPDTGTHRIRRYTITPQAIQNLRGFLDAVGWRLLYGLNLGTGTPQRAADEAANVFSAIGPRLLAFQIGNEPDLYSHNGLRPPTYGFPDYFQDWTTFFTAVRARTPLAPFAGPDVANKVSWVSSFADSARGQAILLTSHHYAEGPPNSPKSTIDTLLAQNERSNAELAAISERARVPYRMSEGNSCYGGGKRGVSDTYASALWAAEYMLRVSEAGFVGVNFHGGGNGAYTPIAGSADQGFSARPIYYGLLLANAFTNARFIAADLNAQGQNVTAYAAKRGRQLLVAIFNKQPAAVNVATSVPARNGRMWRMTAPAIDANSGVTLAGASVTPDGVWSPIQVEPVSVRDGQTTISLGPYEAAFVTFE
jgi:hypothetical protein